MRRGALLCCVDRRSRARRIAFALGSSSSRARLRRVSSSRLAPSRLAAAVEVRGEGIRRSRRFPAKTSSSLRVFVVARVLATRAARTSVLLRIVATRDVVRSSGKNVFVVVVVRLPRARRGTLFGDASRRPRRETAPLFAPRQPLARSASASAASRSAATRARSASSAKPRSAFREERFSFDRAAAASRASRAAWSARATRRSSRASASRASQSRVETASRARATSASARRAASRATAEAVAPASISSSSSAHAALGGRKSSAAAADVRHPRSPMCAILWFWVCARRSVSRTMRLSRWSSRTRRSRASAEIARALCPRRTPPARRFARESSASARRLANASRCTHSATRRASAATAESASPSRGHVSPPPCPRPWRASTRDKAPETSSTPRRTALKVCPTAR